ncbi:hypothetical protein [Trueperella abortisuis]|uniref:hypothetical protein n=1 Tax=Trueperella abortisuis TaxID=445930 RepID=UPI002892DC3C|nr:hypothetical protein [Trueperella abortisuis]
MELTRRELVLEAIDKFETARTIAAQVQQRCEDPTVRELARAINFAAFGAAQLGVALSDPLRVNDLSF